MAYKRKTVDEYDIEADYGYGDGWEIVTCEATYKDAVRAVKEYRQNETLVPFRIRKHRVKIEA
jgi:hypothetical protein